MSKKFRITQVGRGTDRPAWDLSEAQLRAVVRHAERSRSWASMSVRCGLAQLRAALEYDANAPVRLAPEPPARERLPRAEGDA